MRTANTRRTYECAWRDWTHSLNGRDVLGATAEDVVEYVTTIKNRIGELNTRYADGTIRNRFHVLRSIYGFLFDMEVVRVNPFLKASRLIVLRQQAQKRPTKFISESIIRDLLESQKTDTAPELQRATLLHLLFGGGLRRSEARKIKICDCSFCEDGFYTLTLSSTKAGKVQKQSLPTWCNTILNKLIRQRRDDGAGSDDPLFATLWGHGKPIADKTIYRWYREALERYGIKAGPHSARASAVTALKNRGYEDRDVARFLRHSTTHMVEVYDKRILDERNNPGRFLEYRSLNNFGESSFSSRHEREIGSKRFSTLHDLNHRKSE